MKQLILRLVLPLTLIFFMLITKWWFVEAELPIQYLYGFPLPYMAPCIAGGGCVQYFIMPLLTDIAIYFIAILLITWLVHHYHKLYIPSSIGYILWAVNVLYYVPSAAARQAKNPGEFYWQREFKVFHTKQSGFLFLWENEPVIDYTRHRPAKKEKINSAK